ncbi:MAG: hypothetical protein HYY46_12525 [Deltaproteobacteria bacterium]|nr:hypothetical protein [Deltaproteobacteria bacterium]
MISLEEIKTTLEQTLPGSIIEMQDLTDGIPFASEDVLADPAVRDGIKLYSSWPTIPQVFIGAKFVGGCDILYELHERGELKPILKAAFGETE